MGEVGTPGLVDLSGDSPKLISAVAKAGGFKQGALKKAVAIRRFDAAGHAQTLMVDAESTDVTLRANDVVFVPETKLYKTTRYFETVGKVFSPFSNLANLLFSFAYLSGGNN